jgi:hypothetical protein
LTFGYLYSCNFSFRFDVIVVIDNMCSNIGFHILIYTSLNL